MAEFVIKEEGFKFGIFDKVPVAISGQSILLYRKQNGINGSMVIDSAHPPFSADVRRGKFDTMVVFSMGEQSKKVQDKVLVAGYKCYFNVMIEIRYRLDNVREYYFTMSASCENKLEQALKDCIYTQDKEFDLHGSIDLKRELEKQIQNKLQAFSSINISNILVEVQPDDDTQKLINSDVEKMSSIHINENDTDIEINRNREKIRVQQSERELKQVKVQQFAEMYQEFGDMASVMDDYLDGKMSGMKLHEMLREKRREDLAYLKDGLDNDILQEEFARQEYSKKIAGGSLSKEPVLEIETSGDASEDKIEKYIDVQEIGDDDNL